MGKFLDTFERLFAARSRRKMKKLEKVGKTEPSSGVATTSRTVSSASVLSTDSSLVRTDSVSLRRPLAPSSRIYSNVSARPRRPSSIQSTKSTIEKKASDNRPLLRHQATTLSSSLKRNTPTKSLIVPNSTTTTPKSIPKQSLPKTDTKPKRTVISVNHNNNLVFASPTPSSSAPTRQRPVSVTSTGSISSAKAKIIIKRGGQGQTASSKNLHNVAIKEPIKPPEVLKNNNRLDLKDNVIPVHNGDARHRNVIEATSLPNNFDLHDGEVAMQDFASVQEQLEIMAKENASYQDEIRLLLNEKKKLQNQIQLEQMHHASEIEQLAEENTTLRTRLHDVSHSPLSDTEKQQLLLEPTQRQHNSAPASFAASNEAVEGSTNGSYGNNIEAPSSCPTPDWDKHSSSSLSEVSVACLQDRILQMEETHYSTNEELQATLQELSDLQTQLSELQNENEKLSDEKSVLLESLYRQTEKLESSRATVDTLHELLVRDGQEQKDSGTEREQKLVELLKVAQEEREIMTTKHAEMSAELLELRQSAALQGEERERLIDRVRLLESTVDSVHAERKLIDQELAQAKEQSSARRIEISRLTTLLENARAKIDELEKERDQGARSEMDALLDNARKEKDTLESHVAYLQGQISQGQCEKERLQEQLSLLQEELKVCKNNAKSVKSDLEYQLSEIRRDLTTVRTELQTSQDTSVEAQNQSQRHLEDKRNLKALLAELQKELEYSQDLLHETEEKLNDEQRLRKEENEEWEQFQRDLLMTVRVANDFKTEAQTELEKLVHENKALRDKVRALESQLDKLKALKPQTPPLLRQSSAPSETQQSMLTSVQQEMAARRQKAQRQDSRLSVKSLIESIENATKQVKAESRSSSTSSLNSCTSDVRSSSITPPSVPINALTTSGSGTDWNNEDVFVKSPLREQQQMNNKNSRQTNGKTIITDINFGAKCDVGKSEDTIRESVALLSAKNIDFTRRNSYGDLSERKDPLSGLVKNGGSKRNALLKWCQQKTVGYRHIDITNFSSSWNDGLALCAILHTYLPDRVPYDTLVPTEKRRNFSLAFSAAESVGIPTTLNINDMCQLERPDWQQVMAYVTAIYKHFEV